MKDSDWKGIDKLKHLGACFAIALVTPLGAIGAALAKEYGDSKAAGNHWCWWDICADTIGILIGGAIHYLIFKTC